MAVVEVLTTPQMVVMVMGESSSRHDKEEEVAAAAAERAPIFLDFLGTRMMKPPPPPILRSTAAGASASTAQRGAAISVTSAMDSERQGAKGSEIFHFHGRKTSISGQDVGNILSGRKRRNSKSVCLVDGELPGQSNSLENSCMIKMFGKEAASGTGKSRDDNDDDGDVTFSMPRPLVTNSMLLHHPFGRTPGLPASNQGKSIFRKPGQLLYPSRFSQSGSFSGMISSSYMHKDVSQVAAIITQPIADEGSGTSIKQSGALGDSTGFLVPRLDASQTRKSEPSNVVRYQHCRNDVFEKQTSEACAGRQMTIFYSGQAYVFDNVHPKKADAIMALAGSSGGSWSTTYSSKSSEQISRKEAIVQEMQMGKSPLPVKGDMVHEITLVGEIPVAIDLSGVKSGDHHRTRTRTSTAEPNAGDKRDEWQTPI